MLAKHTPTGQLVYKQRGYLEEHDYRSLIITEQQQLNMKIGINEYFSSGVINRCFEQLYEIQKNILKILKTVHTTTWPLADLDVPVEPFLYTNGEQYNDIDDKPYIGFYHIQEQPTGDIYVQGRTPEDGNVSFDGSPTSDRYLSVQ